MDDCLQSVHWDRSESDGGRDNFISLAPALYPFPHCGAIILALAHMTPLQRPQVAKIGEDHSLPAHPLLVRRTEQSSINVTQ